jgi:CheY-like chemotaxis protein
MIATQVSKHHYPYPILDKDTSFYHSHNENSDHYQHYHSQPSYSRHLQNQESNTASVERTRKDAFLKRILVVDDDPDITLTFKVGLEDDKSFEVYAYTDPLEALSDFRPHFYGFELCTRILKVDLNVKICFIAAGDTNLEALREIYPTLSIGCFIKKPVTKEYLAKRLRAELD